MEPECRIKIADFEGPLDLLLYLINRNRLEITDIPIALVTRQYLDYIEIIKALNVAVAGEYLVMAATLVQIKSRMLLPSHDDNEDDDPRLEITGPLQELARIREMAGRLSELPMLGRDIFCCGLATRFGLETPDNNAVPPLDVSMADLFMAMEDVMARQPDKTTFQVWKQEVTLSGQMAFIRQRLNESGGRILFSDLFAEYGRRVVTVTFLALLELVKQAVTLVFQEMPGKEIVIMQRAGWRQEVEDN